MLEPIDFNGIYVAQIQAQAAEAEAAGEGVAGEA
jgi:preprotein translocase subunit SecB